MAGVLEVRDLSKSFDGIVVASHIDLTLQSGSVVGLIGPNGAGKTSLFNLISGVVKFRFWNRAARRLTSRSAEIPSARARRSEPDLAAHAPVPVAAGDRQPSHRYARLSR